MSKTETGPGFTHHQVLRVVWGVVLCIFLAAIDQTVVIPAVPAIAADLRGFGHLSWIVAAYLLTSTAVTPLYGRLSDKHGRRAVLLPAIALFVAASLLCGAAQSLWQLIAARALQGLGGGGLMAMAQAAIADVVAPRERGRYQAYMAGAWAVASIAGPVLGGWVTDAFSWRWIFWINLPIGGLAFLLCSRALRLLPARGDSGQIDYVGAVLLAGATSGCLMVLSWGGTVYPWISAPLLGLAGAGAGALLAFLWHERRVADPLVPPRLFRSGVFVRGVLLAGLATACTFGAIFLLPLFFQLQRGASASQAGTMIVPYLACTVIGAYGSGQLTQRLGRSRPILVAGMAAGAVGFVLLATLGPDSGLGLLLAGMAIVGVGIGACMPTSLVLAQNAADRRDTGVATSSILFLRAIGGAVGSTIAGAILAGQFAAGLARAGIAGQVDLAALRGVGPGAGAGAVPEVVRAAAQHALAGAFHLAFGALAVLLAAGVIVALRLRDVPLRSGVVLAHQTGD